MNSIFEKARRLSGSMALQPLSLDDITVAYNRHPAVHHLSGTFRQGTMTAIAGPNGAGKSTLLKAVMGLVPLAEGKVDLGGLKRGEIGYLPQAAEIDRSFPISVADTVAMGAWQRIGAFRRIDAGARAHGAEALAAVGLEGFEKRPISSLSAGQFQRVLFARLLMQDADLIILDEPFTAIDARTSSDLMGLLHRWNSEGRTIIAVLHDFDQIRDHFAETLLLAREAIEWGPTNVALSSENLLRARAMAEKWDEDAEICKPGRAA